MHFAFGAAVLALLIVGIVPGRSLLAASESERWLTHTNKVLEHIDGLRAAGENTYTAYTGFALSGQSEFLERARAALSRVDLEQNALRAVTADNPHQQRRLASLAGLVEQTKQQGDDLGRLSQGSGSRSAADVMREGRSAPILDEFRAVTRDMGDEERRLSFERNGDAE